MIGNRMKRSLWPASAALVMLGAGALAQTTPPPAPMPAQPGAATPPAQAQPGTAAAPARPAPEFATDQQILDEVNARIALLKAQLRLTDAQAQHWPRFETALRDARMARAKGALAMQRQMMTERDAYRERMRQWREERRRSDASTAMPPGSAMSDVDAMRARADTMAARASELRAIADSAGPLYAALEEGQRNQLMRGIRNVGEGIRAMRGGERGWREDRRRGRDGWDE